MDLDLLLILSAAVILLSRETLAAFIPVFEWSTTNSIFESAIQHTQHVHVGDQLQLRCRHPASVIALTDRHRAYSRCDGGVAPMLTIRCNETLGTEPDGVYRLPIFNKPPDHLDLPHFQFNAVYYLYDIGRYEPTGREDHGNSSSSEETNLCQSHNMRIPLLVGPNYENLYPDHNHLSAEEEAVLVRELFEEGHHASDQPHPEKRTFVYRVIERVDESNSTVVMFELIITTPSSSASPTSSAAPNQPTPANATSQPLQSGTPPPSRYNDSSNLSDDSPEERIVQSTVELLDGSFTAESEMQIDACCTCCISLVILNFSLMLGAKIL